MKYAFLLAAMGLALLALVLPSRQQPPTSVNVVTDDSGLVRPKAQSDSILNAQPRDGKMVVLKTLAGVAAVICFLVGAGVIGKVDEEGTTYVPPRPPPPGPPPGPGPDDGSTGGTAGGGGGGLPGDPLDKRLGQ